jgi:hypothetical protein
MLKPSVKSLSREFVGNHSTLTDLSDLDNVKTFFVLVTVETCEYAERWDVVGAERLKQTIRTSPVGDRGMKKVHGRGGEEQPDLSLRSASSPPVMNSLATWMEK